MSDWADFCESFGINPNEPDEFDELLDSFFEKDEPIPIHKITGNVIPFRQLADKHCGKCRGTGYISKFKWNCGGRCFDCIPDRKLNQYKSSN